MPTIITKTVGGPTPDFATWTLFGAGISADLSPSGDDEQWIGKGRDVEFLEDFALSGVVTTATNNVVISYDTGAKSNGVSRDAGGSGCTIKGSNVAGTIRSAIQNLTIKGVDLATSVNGELATFDNVSYTAGNFNCVKDCVLRGLATSSSLYLMAIDRLNLNVEVINCNSHSGRRFCDTRTALTALIEYCNILIQSDQLGIVSDSELTANNNYVGHDAAASSECYWTGGASPSGSNNVSSDASATIDYPTDSLINKAAADQFVSIVVGSEDLTPKAGNVLKGAGKVTSTTEDLLGVTRGLSTTTVGAIEDVPASVGGDILPTPLSVSIGIQI